MNTESDERDIYLELAGFKLECVTVFSALSKVISAQVGVTVAITETLNDQGFLPAGEKRTGYFSTLRKPLAELEEFNELLTNMIESSKRELVDASKRLSMDSEPSENE